MTPNLNAWAPVTYDTLAIKVVSVGMLFQVNEPSWWPRYQRPGTAPPCSRTPIMSRRTGPLAPDGEFSKASWNASPRFDTRASSRSRLVIGEVHPACVVRSRGNRHQFADSDVFVAVLSSHGRRCWS